MVETWLSINIRTKLGASRSVVGDQQMYNTIAIAHALNIIIFVVISILFRFLITTIRGFGS